MSTKLVIPYNFSNDDPLPFECAEDDNVVLSLGLYLLQSAYLILGIVLNALIIKNILMQNKVIYRENSFYTLYTADAIVAMIRCLFDVCFARFIALITPLCPILSPYFFSPSIITKTYYTILHYSISFRTISQILMSFNRMTCVIFPLKHDRMWNKLLYPVLLILFLIPLDNTWIIVLSRVYTNPFGSGFSVNYKETAGWPKLSLIHLSESLFCFLILLFCSITTIIGLKTMQNRVKSAERSLTFTTMVMATQTLLFAMSQIYFAFFATSTPNLRSIVFSVLPYVSDSIYVFSPICLIFMNQRMKADIFKMKSMQRGSRSVSMTQQPAMYRINSRVNII